MKKLVAGMVDTCVKGARKVVSWGTPTYGNFLIVLKTRQL